MPKFMNAELIAIRDALTCGCCEQTFQGSDSQAWKVKYEKATVYCSPACRSKKRSEKLRKPVPLIGQCHQCHVDIYSRNPNRRYCSRACYNQSNQFAAMLKNNQEALAKHDPVKVAIRQLNAAVGNVILGEQGSLMGLRAKGRRTPVATTYFRTGKLIRCLNCQVEKYVAASSKQKYCSRKCYVTYKANRFERWRLHPEPLIVIDDYEAFLNRDILTCIVEGCNWSGKHLTLHVNQTHGIPAEEFKAIFGFNKSTGVIGKDLSNRYSARELVGVAKFTELSGHKKALDVVRGRTHQPRAAQATENAAKGRASTTVPNPIRTCVGCDSEFEQSTPFGKAKYCTRDCRKQHYAKLLKSKSKVRVRQTDGTFSWTDRPSIHRHPA